MITQLIFCSFHQYSLPSCFSNEEFKRMNCISCKMPTYLSSEQLRMKVEVESIQEQFSVTIKVHS